MTVSLGLLFVEEYPHREALKRTARYALYLGEWIKK